LKFPIKKRAQVAFEFVILVSILFTVLIVFTSFVRDNYSDARSDNDYFILKDIALSVRAELNIAATVQDGFERSFFIPLTIEGVEYNITKEVNSLLFTTSESDYAVNIPPYTGDIIRGNNYVKKVAGVIEVNQ
jgi:hypothetical protein